MWNKTLGESIMCKHILYRVAGLFALLVSFMLPAVSFAAIPEPVLMPGNPSSCSDLDPRYYEIKFDNVNGPFNYSITQDGVTVAASYDGGSISWIADAGIDVVLVKASAAANAYFYSPEALSDSGLLTPVNNSGGNAGLSHLSFCYDYEVAVAKTAVTTFTREYRWSIAKSVTPDSMNRFIGESGTAEYTVSADRTDTDSNWAVSGTITITNPAPTAALITSVMDHMGGLAAAVDCRKEDNTVAAMPYTLQPGASLACTYSAALPDGTQRLNTATVDTFIGRVDGDPPVEYKVFGNSGNADVLFGDPASTVGPASVTVNDAASDGFSQSWNMAGDASESYRREFSCPTDLALYRDGLHSYSVNNTASIAETGQSASASVTMNCYAPLVSKSANTSYNRYHAWNINKSVDQPELLLSIGQTYLLTYRVDVSVTASDADFAVAGMITVHNPRPDAAMVVGIADYLPGATSMTLACGGSLTVPAGGSASCGYEAAVADRTSDSNTAQASLNGVTVSATVPVSFGAPANVTDECATIDDSYPGNGVFPDTICGNMSYVYQRLAGPYPEAGSYELLNTACFTTNDTATQGCDDQVVKITVPPDGIGCTLTQGYWRTHSKYGPAPYDETWLVAGTEALGGLEDAGFFLSGQTYHQVLWTAPKGNVYYNLAHQWIAAYLNSLNGASVPADVQLAWDRGQVLLNTYSPAQILALKGKNATSVRTEFIQLGGILDAYNNGLAGTEHCSEEAQSQ
jgi:hypothetical protein